MSRITALAAAGALDDNDLMEIIDVSDTSMAATGTNKRALLSALRTFFRAGLTVNQKSEKLYGRAGALTVSAGTARLYFPRAVTIFNIYAFVQTAPTGASIVIDVNLNGGTSLFNTTPANRPTIAAGSRIDLSSVPDQTAINAGDYLTFDVDAIGSTVAGSDLTVGVEFIEAIS